MTRRRQRSTVPTIDVLIATPAWRRRLRTAASISRNAAAATLTAGRSGVPGLGRRELELAIVLTSDAVIRKLNAAYRGQDKPTNVLSFSALNDTRAPTTPNPGPAVLGDVVVAFETLSREAKTSCKPLKNHLSHLVVHGVLHLLGYDHDKAAAAATMERLEIQILARLGIPDPYSAVPAKAPAARRRRS